MFIRGRCESFLLECLNTGTIDYELFDSILCRLDNGITTGNKDVLTLLGKVLTHTPTLGGFRKVIDLLNKMVAVDNNTSTNLKYFSSDSIITILCFDNVNEFFNKLYVDGIAEPILNSFPITKEALTVFNTLATHVADSIQTKETNQDILTTAGFSNMIALVSNNVLLPITGNSVYFKATDGIWYLYDFRYRYIVGMETPPIINDSIITSIASAEITNVTIPDAFREESELEKLQHTDKLIKELFKDKAENYCLTVEDIDQSGLNLKELISDTFLSEVTFDIKKHSTDNMYYLSKPACDQINTIISDIRNNFAKSDNETNQLREVNIAEAFKKFIQPETPTGTLSKLLENPSTFALADTIVGDTICIALQGMFITIFKDTGFICCNRTPFLLLT